MLKDFIDKAKLIHNNFYDYSNVEYKNNKSKVNIICPVHGVFEQTPKNHIQGQGCKKCSFDKLSEKFRKTKSQLLKDFVKIHDHKYDYSLIGDYKNNSQKLKIICLIHGIFEQTAHSHLSGRGCQKCAVDYKSKKLSRSTLEFIHQSNVKHDNFFSYSETKYINNKSKVIVTCPIHGNFKTIPSHHLNGIGCPKCAGNYVRTEQEYIDDCKKIHGEKYDYSLTKFKTIKTKVIIICKEHGTFSQTANHHLNGHGCPICNSSRGENKIRRLLNLLNIEYVEQKKFDDCKNINKLAFDFYLPKLNICIEYNGKQHYEAIEHFGGEKSLTYSKKNDNIKRYFCKKNNIKLKSISYKKFNKLEGIIKKIINN